MLANRQVFQVDDFDPHWLCAVNLESHYGYYTHNRLVCDLSVVLRASSRSPLSAFDSDNDDLDDQDDFSSDQVDIPGQNGIHHDIEINDEPLVVEWFNFEHALIMTWKEKKYKFTHEWLLLRCPHLLLEETQHAIANAPISLKALNIFYETIHAEYMTDLTNDVTLMIEICCLLDICHLDWHTLLFSHWSPSMHPIFDQNVSMKKKILSWLMDVYLRIPQYPSLYKLFNQLLMLSDCRLIMNAQDFKSIRSLIPVERVDEFLACVTGRTLMQEVDLDQKETPVHMHPFITIYDIFSQLATQTQPPLNTSVCKPPWSALIIMNPDFTLHTVDGTSIRCHSLVLYYQWSYFRKMIQFGGKEANEKEMTFSEDWSGDRLRHMLNYLYIDKITFSDIQDMIWLYQTGIQYEYMNLNRVAWIPFVNLVKYYRQRCFARVRFNNFMEMYKVAHTLNDPVRINACETYIIDHFEKIMHNKDACQTLAEYVDADKLRFFLFRSYRQAVPKPHKPILQINPSL